MILLELCMQVKQVYIYSRKGLHCTCTVVCAVHFVMGGLSGDGFKDMTLYLYMKRSILYFNSVSNNTVDFLLRFVFFIMCTISREYCAIFPSARSITPDVLTYSRTVSISSRPISGFPNIPSSAARIFLSPRFRAVSMI